MQAQLRALFGRAFGIDLALDDREAEMQMQSVYEVLDIDLEIEPPEITLMDQVLGVPVVVDLQPPEARTIEKSGLTVGTLILTALSSKADSLGMTKAWRLANEIRMLSN
jgi:hypothetical protein